MTTPNNNSGTVKYRDCMEFQQKLYARIDQTEQRTMDRLTKMEAALSVKIDEMRGKVYYNAGIISVIVGLTVALVTILMRGR